MKITKKQLKQIIKEELDQVLAESGDVEKLLGFEPEHDEQGFPVPVSTAMFFKRAQEYIARNRENMTSGEKGLISNAITNRLVKDQLPKDDPLAMDLKGLLNWLDPDRPRRQNYRRSKSSQMRAADPTGMKQKQQPGWTP